MNSTILAVGSQGDVQPYVALANRLRLRGYNVTLATSERFRALAEGRGLRFAPLRADFMQLLETAEGKAALSGGNPLGLMRKVQPMLRQMLDDAWGVAQGADLLIYHPKALGGPHIAERLGVRGILALPLPLFSPTSAFPSPVLPVGNLGPFNRLSHQLVARLSVAPYRKLINQWRGETLGLGPSSNEMQRDGRPIPRIYPYSRHVLPIPADWDATTQVPGYWFLDTPPNWQPPASLDAFLRAGSPPVYVGFGSMAAEDARRKTEIVVAALKRAGVRGVIATGAGGLAPDDLPGQLCTVESVPHDWLFPQMAAVVHHGGAGTTAAGLRAGLPTVICPFFGDQPFWGRRVAALGVGPQPISQKRLSVDTLTTAISTAVGDTAMRQRAAALGSAIRTEDGIGNTIAFIESIM